MVYALYFLFRMLSWYAINVEVYCGNEKHFYSKIWRHLNNIQSGEIDENEMN